MIAYLNGTLRSLATDRAVVMAGGVGYLVNIPLSTYYKLEGASEAALFIHTHVREDALALYGFATLEEQTVFEKLISISGIGPRLAQVILSGISTEDLAEAVMRGDSRRLSAIPGVGKKTSERICLELRDKLLLPEGDGKQPAPLRPVGIDDDVLSALANLGYRSAVAQTALDKAHKELGDSAEFSQLLRAALRQLTR